MSRYAVASFDTDFDQRVRQALGATNGSVVGVNAKLLEQGPAAVLAHLASDQITDVLALGPSIRLEDALGLARHVDEAHPEINVVLVSPETDPRLLEDALRVGVRDVVAADADDATLCEALHRAARSASRRRSNLTGDPHDGRGDHRVSVVLSPKGGSGKTMVATNLAAGLAEGNAEEVALLDLDLSFGDTASALGLAPEHSVASAVQTLGRHDPLALKVHLTAHRSGLLAMCAPDRPELGETVTSQQSAEVLDLLADEFRHVVVDTPAGLDDHTLSAVERATDLVLVCTMDVSSVRSLHKLVLALDELGHTAQRRHFVLNRAASRVGLDAEDIERTVGMPVAVAVPSHRSVPLSMNQGTPLALERSRGRVQRALGELVERFERQPAAARSWTAQRRR